MFNPSGALQELSQQLSDEQQQLLDCPSTWKTCTAIRNAMANTKKKGSSIVQSEKPYWYYSLLNLVIFNTKLLNNKTLII